MAGSKLARRLSTLLHPGFGQWRDGLGRKHGVCHPRERLASTGRRACRLDERERYTRVMICVQEVLAHITWYHHIILLEKVKDEQERLWYILICAEERPDLSRHPYQKLRIVNRSTSHHREHGPQRRQVVDRAGDRVRAESHQVGELAGFEGAAPMALAAQLRTGHGVQLHSRILVDGILRPLDACFQRAPGHHAPERKQRVERADRVVSAGGERGSFF